MPAEVKTIDAYLARVPTFRLHGALVGSGATANHCACYLLSSSTVSDHSRELANYDTSKGTIRFQPDQPLPAALVRTLVRARMRENAGARGTR